MKHVATAVIVERFNRETSRHEEHRVPMSDAPTLDYGTARVVKVEWEEGGWSWAKAWYFKDSPQIARIGAGAYGDLTVWEGVEDMSRRYA